MAVTKASPSDAQRGPAHHETGQMMVSWYSSAQLCFICYNRRRLGDPAGPHGEDKELQDPKTLGEFGLRLPLEFWPHLLPSGEKCWETKWCLVAPMGFCKNQWVGANSPRAFIFTNLHLLAKIQVALTKTCHEKRLISVVPVILSCSYSSWVRLWEEQMGTDFLICEALVLKYFIVLWNTQGCVWNRKSL